MLSLSYVDQAIDDVCKEYRMRTKIYGINAKIFSIDYSIVLS